VLRGVEPAQNLWNMYEDLGLRVWGGYWGQDAAQALGECGKFDIIIAVNVLPHVPNPQDFMEACKLMLDSTTKGSGIYIQTSQCDMFENGEFDAVYHEHHSYFTASSFGTLAYGTGLEIKEACKVPIHSMSFLFRLGPMTGNGHCDALFDLIEEENAGGWHTVDGYRIWAADAEICKADLLIKLEDYKEQGHALVGYGASAKCNTVFNYIRSDLDFIVDDNPAKWGLYTPGRNIPIVSPDDARLKGTHVTWVMTTWNFKDEIKAKIYQLSKHYSWPIYLINYIPEVTVEPLIDYGRSKTEDTLS
jgi:hypothetical protein